MRATRLAVLDVVEQAELDAGRVLGEDREVDALAVPGRAQRVRRLRARRASVSAHELPLEQHDDAWCQHAPRPLLERARARAAEARRRPSRAARPTGRRRAARRRGARRRRSGSADQQRRPRAAPQQHDGARSSTVTDASSSASRGQRRQLAPQRAAARGRARAAAVRRCRAATSRAVERANVPRTAGRAARPAARRPRTPRARPSRTASTSSGSPWLVKYRNGAVSPYSSPMKSSGTNGDSSTAPAASFAALEARRSASSRSPSARLPTWSWFCEQTTNRLAGEPGGRARRGGARGSRDRLPVGTRTPGGRRRARSASVPKSA